MATATKSYQYTIGRTIVRIAVGDEFRARTKHSAYQCEHVEITGISYGISDTTVSYRVNGGSEFTISGHDAALRAFRGTDNFLGTAWEKKPEGMVWSSRLGWVTIPQD